MASYNHKDIEAKWQKKWDEEKEFRTDPRSDKPKWYGLIEFPYPSGAGLHVGHVRSYTGMDIIARKRRAEGYEVLFPIGWDAFGLPAENYAIKTGIHPSITTKENIDNFRRQLKACGFSFDWDREVNTTDPAYYKWTQWIFLKMYEKGLAYKKEMPVNWCPKDKCVLANEEVVDGACERCGTPVEKKNKEQWMLGITKYAERLNKDLDETDYLEKIKIQQRNWIGLSEGGEIEFPLVTGSFKSSFKVFTTRADTLYGATCTVLAPEHPLVNELLEKGLVANKDQVRSYISTAVAKLDIDRSAEGKEKTGVILEGVEAINPATKEKIPVYIADYVLNTYGTGALMAVPAHDERDFEFAQKYGIPIRNVIAPVTGTPQENPEMNRRVVSILWDRKNEKFLSVNWGPTLGGNLFIGGGVDGEEDAEVCAKREIEEETGYKNVKMVSRTPTPIFHSYFAHSKNVARQIEATGFLFELIDEEKGEEQLEENEKGKFTIEWLHRKDAKEKVKDELHSLVFKLLVEGEMYTEEGILVNSGDANGMTSAEARTKITESVGGSIVKKSKLRDWVFARQRYWGEPIPVVYDKEGIMHPVHESNLPIVLPQVDKYEPTDNGESPLYQVPEWVNIKGRLDKDGFFHEDKDGEEFRRETDTMPQWAGSSWYFMRYVDPHNSDALGEHKLLTKWLPVDWYNGGMEHTTLHLLYSRFWYKFLFDIGLVTTSEPYHRRTSQGMILGEGGVKMSKSLGNVVNPDDIVSEYGADTLRMYEMFIGPFDQAIAWNPQAVVGVRRFLDRVYGFKDLIKDGNETLSITHQTIKKVSEDIDHMAFNTAISQMMIWANAVEKEGAVSKTDFATFLKLLQPFAPHMANELWETCGFTDRGALTKTAWPTFDPAKIVENEAVIAIQVGGKTRGTMTLPRDMDNSEVEIAVKNTDIYKRYVGDSTPKKVIIVKNKIINIVI